MKEAEALEKIATLPKILEAATFLHNLGLLDVLPNEVVKRYMGANPDINELFGKTKEQPNDKAE